MITSQEVLIIAGVSLFVWALLTGSTYVKYHRTIEKDANKAAPFNIDKAMMLFIFVGLMLLTAAGIELFKFTSMPPNQDTYSPDQIAKYSSFYPASEVLAGVAAFIGGISWFYYFLLHSGSKTPKS